MVALCVLTMLTPASMARVPAPAPIRAVPGGSLDTASTNSSPLLLGPPLVLPEVRLVSSRAACREEILSYN